MTLRGKSKSMYCWKRAQISVMRYKILEEKLKTQNSPFVAWRDGTVVKSSYRRSGLGSLMGQLRPT